MKRITSRVYIHIYRFGIDFKYFDILKKKLNTTKKKILN
jgi:hypothetical protein